MWPSLAVNAKKGTKDTLESNREGYGKPAPTLM